LSNLTDRKIVAVDIESDVDVLGMQIQTVWIMKPCDLAAS